MASFMAGAMALRRRHGPVPVAAGGEDAPGFHLYLAVASLDDLALVREVLGAARGGRGRRCST